jgi:phosphoadenosine phosphosulfate reductase
MQTDFDGLTLIDKSIARLKEFEPEEGYYLAFSGGKDSVVLYDLAVKSGVKFDAHYACGGLDPPELMQFIKANYPDVIWEKSPQPFWQAFQKNGLPTRLARWCCALIKENNGSNRYVLTGVRWAESVNRKQKRKMVEACNKKMQFIVNPIIEWKESEVWGYIRENKLSYCSLYDEGFKRLGCVLCPMVGGDELQLQLKRFPKLASVWKSNAERYYTNHIWKTDYKWKNFDEYWNWWLARKGRVKQEQCQMFLGDN